MEKNKTGIDEMINSNLTTSGVVSFTVIDEHGNVKLKKVVKNLVVQTGKDLIAANFAGTSTDTVTHIGLGTGTTAADNAQTSLVTPLTPRVAATPVVASNPAKVTYSATFGPGVATGSITEAGLFTALTAGTMVCRTTFTAIPKAAGDTVIINWELNFA